MGRRLKTMAAATLPSRAPGGRPTYIPRYIHFVRLPTPTKAEMVHASTVQLQLFKNVRHGGLQQLVHGRGHTYNNQEWRVELFLCFCSRVGTRGRSTSGGERADKELAAESSPAYIG